MRGSESRGSFPCLTLPAHQPSLCWAGGSEGSPRASFILPGLSRGTWTPQWTAFGPDMGGAEGSGGEAARKWTTCPQPRARGHSPVPPGPVIVPGSARHQCWGPRAKTLRGGGLQVPLGQGPSPALAPAPLQVEWRWLTVQLAASHSPLAAPDDPLRLALHSIWSRGEDVELVLFWTGEGVCQGLNVTVHPTGLLGQYQSASRRMLEDPQWLGQYLAYVSKFHLQEGPVFNLDDQCPPPEASVGATP
nr:uncharacterized protein LOC116152564 isoform X2 [Camelus dromedarius]